MPTIKKRKTKTSQEIPTASMPDIIFILLTFFMVTTVLRETELLVNVAIPTAEAVEKIDQKRLIQYVYVGPERLPGGLGDPAVQVDDAIVREMTDIRNVMYRRMLEEPRTIVSLRVDRTVETGLLYDVQQELREAEAVRVNYSTTSEVDA